MTDDAPRRTKKQLAMVEQEKAMAFRRGIAAFKAGAGVATDPYKEDPRDHMSPAWVRGFEAERKLRTEINPRERSL